MDAHMGGRDTTLELIQTAYLTSRLAAFVDAAAWSGFWVLLLAFAAR